MAEFADKNNIPVVFINREPLEADIEYERYYAETEGLDARQRQ